MNRGPSVRRIVLPLAALLLGGCAPNPPEPDDAAFALADSIVRAWVDDGTIAGAVLSVAHQGQTLFEEAYGSVQTHEYGAGQYSAGEPIEPAFPAPRTAVTPMRIETAFDLASVTKVMATTFAMMLLVDRGLVDLDAPVSRVLTDFVGGGKDAITPRHLLTHRAGLFQWQPTYYAAGNPDEAYAYIRDLPLAWAVGDERHYSDLGFMLLGRMVEVVSGDRLDRFLARELYGPLGLTSTAFVPTDLDIPGQFAATSHGNPFEYRMVHDTTFGYRFAGDPQSWDGWRRHTLVGEVNDGNAFHAFGGVAGHAGLFSTAADLQQLLTALLDSGSAGGRPLVREETVVEFLATTGDGQALGWQVPDYAPPGSFTHTGFTGTWVLGVPRDGVSVVLLTNRQNGGVDATSRYPDVGPLQRAVAGALLDGVAP